MPRPIPRADDDDPYAPPHLANQPDRAVIQRHPQPRDPNALPNPVNQPDRAAIQRHPQPAPLADQSPPIALILGVFLLMITGWFFVSRTTQTTQPSLSPNPPVAVQPSVRIPYLVRGATNLNVRSAPNLNSQILCELNASNEVDVSAIVRDSEKSDRLWAVVHLPDGRTGYSSLSYLVPKSLVDDTARSSDYVDLAQIGDPRAAPALRLFAEESSEAREALRSIGRENITLSESIATLLESRTWGPLKVFLRSTTSSRVDDEIAKLGDRAVPFLLEAVNDNNPKLRSASCHLLGRVKCIDAIPRMIELLEENECSKDAMTALAQIGEAAIPWLVEALKKCEHYHDNRCRAAEALSQLGEPIVPILLRELEGSDYLMAAKQKTISPECVFTALNPIGEPAVRALIEAMLDDERGMSSTARGILVRFQEVTARVIIREQWTKFGNPIKLPFTESFTVRFLNEIIVDIGDAAIPELMAALRSGETWYTTTVMIRMGEKGIDVVPTLVEALEKGGIEPTARREICRILERVGDGRAWKILRELANTSDPEVQPYAQEALYAIKRRHNTRGW